MIIIDLEMSGLDSRKCGIVEIGAIELENPSNTFNQLARLDEDEIVLNEPTATKTVFEVIGKTEEDLRNNKLQNQKELLENFFEWVSKIKEKVFVAQNSMDLEYLIHKSKKFNLPRVHFRYLDLGTIAQVKYLEINKKLLLDFEGWSSMNLTNIAQFCGLKDERKEHTGIEDAKFEAEMLNRLLNGEKLLEEYSNYEIPEYLKK